tara:strand:+ start:257 stop:988 length:732 start_codon:yes stop_codon:yes gene_type:complete
MAYTQQFGRPSVESSAINYLTDKDKKKTTVKTEVNKNAVNDKGISGTMKTQTTTDTTSGKRSTPGNLPKKTYAQLEAEGGNVAAAKAYNASKNTSSTAVNTKNRFTPNATPIIPYGIETKAPEIKANLSGAAPLKNPTVTMAVSKGPGVNKTGRRNASRAGGMGGASSYTQDKKTMSSEKASNTRTAVNVANSELEDKYSAKNITANLNRRGITNPAAIQKAINKGKARINANTTTIDYYKKN